MVNEYLAEDVKMMWDNIEYELSELSERYSKEQLALMYLKFVKEFQICMEILSRHNIHYVQQPEYKDLVAYELMKIERMLWWKQ